jgi:hypothetical protein
LLLAILADPRVPADGLTPSERRHLRRLAPLEHVDDPAWRVLSAREAQRGRAAVTLLMRSLT